MAVTLFGGDLVSGEMKEPLFRIGLLCLSCREGIFRPFAWVFGNERNWSHVGASLFFSTAIDFAREGLCLFFFDKPVSPFDLTLQGGSTAFLMGMLGVSPKKAFHLYKETLFDYPRKIKPPKDRETEKVKAKFQDFWAGIKERLRNLAPSPSPSPAYAPVRREINRVSSGKAAIPA